LKSWVTASEEGLSTTEL